MSDTPKLKKSLRVVDGVAILVGITIGAGIYSTPQIIAGYLSSVHLILLLWCLVGVFAFLGSLVYAELATRLPETGGEYVWIRRSFGPHVGFLFGWSQLLIIRTSPAAGLSLIAADYLGFFVDLAPWQHTGIALAIIVVLGIFNYVGVERAGAFQKVTTFLKLLGIFGLTGAGLVVIALDHWGAGVLSPPLMTSPSTSDLDPMARFSATMILIVFSFMGWDRVGYVAGEMKRPQRVVPITMLAGMSLILLSYLSTNWLYHQTLGIDGVRGSVIVASDAAVKLVGPVGAALVALLVIISTVGSTNGTMMTATRVYYAMARDGIFLKWLDFVHPRFLTPSRAVIAHCVWAAVILLVRQNFETIVAGMTFAVLIFYALATVALFRLRRSGVGHGNIFKVPFYPVLPGIYLAGIILLVILRLVFEFEKSLVDLCFILSGLPVAWYWCRKPGGQKR